MLQSKGHGWQGQLGSSFGISAAPTGENHYVWNYFKPVIDREIAAGNVSRSFRDMFEQHRQRISAKREARG